MRIEYLEEYIDLATTLNFTKTAKKRFITQPALSNHISIIENRLGLKLFIRTTHDVKMTEEGKIIYEKIKDIVDSYDELLKDAECMSKQLKGELTLGILYYAIPEYVIPIVEKFHSDYPNNTLHIVSCQPHQIYQLLKEDRIDAGMVCYFGDSEPQFLEYHTFMKEKLCIMTSSSHPFAKRKCVSVEDLRDELIVDEIADKEWTASIHNLLGKKGLVPKRVVHAPQVDLMPLVLEKTLGVSIVPDLLKNMNNNKISFIDIDDEDFSFEMGICYKPDNNNPSLQLLLKVCDVLGLQ